MNFWEKVDEELKYSGKTRKELANEADFDVSYISKGIARNGMPLADLALRISHALDIPLETLLGMSKDKVQESGDKENNNSYLLKKYSILIENLEKLSVKKQEKVTAALLDLIKLLNEK